MRGANFYSSTYSSIRPALTGASRSAYRAATAASRFGSFQSGRTQWQV